MAKKSAAIRLVGFAILIVLVAASYAVYQAKISKVVTVPLPEKVAALTLGRSIFGCLP